MTCAIDGCERPSRTRHMCSMHYHRFLRHGNADEPVVRTIHGGSHTDEYHIWIAMKSRCYRKTTNRYNDYGGRGIKVCDRWLHDFSAFLADMGRRPGPEYSIDREDVNGNYEPGNCRWATPSQQVINQRLRRDNPSGYRGVRCRTARKNKWSAFIVLQGRRFHLGTFDTAVEAAYVRDQFALVLHGEFARLNFEYVGTPT